MLLSRIVAQLELFQFYGKMIKSIINLRSLNENETHIHGVVSNKSLEEFCQHFPYIKYVNAGYNIIPPHIYGRDTQRRMMDILNVLKGFCT